MTLGADTTLSTLQSVIFYSTVDGAHALTISGVGELFGAVGSSTALTSLSVSGPTTDSASNITTTGDQTYTGPVALQVGTVIASTGSGAVTFGSTVDGANTLEVDTAGPPHSAARSAAILR